MFSGQHFAILAMFNNILGLKVNLKAIGCDTSVQVHNLLYAIPVYEYSTDFYSNYLVFVVKEG